MSAVLLGRAEHDTPEWHALRAAGIGASEIAAVVGLSKWVSPFALWHIKKGNIPGQAQSSAMSWGNRLEPVIIDWFREQHPEAGVEASPGTFGHADRSWQRCNPDGLIHYSDSDMELLQVKCSRFGDGFGKAGTDEVPLAYRCQVQQEMDIFSVRRTRLVVLIGGNEPREYLIHADGEDQHSLRVAGQAFWDSLSAGDEPPLDCTEMTLSAVRELHPDINGLDADLPGPCAVEYFESKADLDAATDRHRLAKSTVLQSMGEARRALVGGIPVLRRQPSGKNGIALHPIKEAS